MVFAHSFAGAIAGKYIIDKIKKSKELNEADKSSIYLAAIIGSIAPDFDLIVNLLKIPWSHRYLVTHSFAFYTVLIVLANFIFRKKYNMTTPISFYIGILTHLFIDMLLGGIVFFAPFSKILVGLPMSFKAFSSSEFAAKYINSNYMLIEVSLIFIYWLCVYRREKNKIARKLPFFWAAIAIITLAVLML